MKKRIEDITADDVILGMSLKEYHNFGGLIDAFLSFIKANLDTGKREPMSRAEVLSALDESLGDSVRIFSDRELDAIRALTVQQGFVPDWSKAPKDAEGVAIIWNGFGYGCACYSQIERDTNSALIKFIPRPAPKMRQKTDEQLLEDLVESYFNADGKAGLAEHDTRLADAWAKVAREMVAGKSIHDLCRAAGIPLETTE